MWTTGEISFICSLARVHHHYYYNVDITTRDVTDTYLIQTGFYGLHQVKQESGAILYWERPVVLAMIRKMIWSLCDLECKIVRLCCMTGRL